MTADSGEQGIETARSKPNLIFSTTGWRASGIETLQHLRTAAPFHGYSDDRFRNQPNVSGNETRSLRLRVEALRSEEAQRVVSKALKAEKIRSARESYAC